MAHLRLKGHRRFESFESLGLARIEFGRMGNRNLNRFLNHPLKMDGRLSIQIRKLEVIGEEFSTATVLVSQFMTHSDKP